MRRFSSLFLCALAAIAGCGRENQATLVATVQSSGTGTARTDFLAVYGIHYSSDSSSTELTVHDEAAESVELSDFYPHKLMYPSDLTEGIEVWIVGRTATQTQLRAYTDADADRIIDASTATVLFTGTEPKTVLAAAFDAASGTLYLLDDDGDLYRAVDTNGDSRPDTISAVPFTAATWDPEMPDPVWLEVEDPETGEVELIPGGRSATATALLDPDATGVTLMASMAEIGRVQDDTGDGVADTLIELEETAVVDPAILDDPLVANRTRIHVRASTGATVELQRVDENDVLIDVLATGVAAEQGVTFSLGTGLGEGDRVRAKDTTNDRISETLEVGEAVIVVYAPASPLIIDVDEAISLVVEGANLSRVAVVSLRQQFVDAPTQLTLDLEFEVAADGKSMTVEIPILGEDWDGYAVLFCCADGTAAEYGMLTLAACKNEVGGGGSSGG